jgi:XRE family transcriptional regulator, regulator of sulfur utilization
MWLLPAPAIPAASFDVLPAICWQFEKLTASAKDVRCARRAKTSLAVAREWRYGLVAVGSPVSALDLGVFCARYVLMLASRNSFIVAASALVLGAVVALAQSVAKPILHSSVFHWNSLNVEVKPTGERRQVFDAPTATLDRLESHITTLNPGEAPHAAHQHPEEELFILKEGTLEVMQNGRTNRVEAGGMIFCAANEPHGWRNVGTNRAVYYVVKWVVPGQLKARPQ